MLVSVVASAIAGITAGVMAVTGADVGAIGSAIVALLLGVVGTYFIQRNRTRDRTEELIVSGADSQATITIAAITEWQKIVAAQGAIQSQQVIQIDQLRDRAEACEEQGRELMRRLVERENDIARLTLELEGLRGRQQSSP